MSETYYNEKEAAEYVKYSFFALRNWRLANDPEGPKYVKTKKGRVVYRESDLIEWLEGR
jgi:predicted DNA-binding transcriptional regulator AlpA